MGSQDFIRQTCTQLLLEWNYWKIYFINWTRIGHITVKVKAYHTARGCCNSGMDIRPAFREWSRGWVPS